jgi:hypothetical protein
MKYPATHLWKYLNQEKVYVPPAVLGLVDTLIIGVMLQTDSEETSVKVHCISNATRIIPRPKRCHGNIPRSNMSQDVTGSFKEYSCTNSPAFMHLINLTASLLHKRCKKSLTTAKLKSLSLQFAS